MQKLKIKEIIALIEQEKTFEATPLDGSFNIKVNKYVPFCCTAIHDGGNLRNEIKEKISIDDYGRWYEEDPHTGEFIESMPITLIGLDSRFEYDLNRHPSNCIYDEAWGNKVWKKPLTPTEKSVSLRKHANYYMVVHALIKKLELLFGSCVVYDIHSYNYQRWDRTVPLFNIGTERIDQQKYTSTITHWKTQLSSLKISDVENQTTINDVFYGRGHQLTYITKHFSNVLVLATEIKKVFSNELTGENFPKRIKEIQGTLKQAIINNSYFFSQEHTKWKSGKVLNLLDQKMDPAIYLVDKKLLDLLQNFELLAFVNPRNTSTELIKFSKSKYTELPKFKYAPIKINPFELKQKLSLLRTQDISDITIRNLYESVINSYFDKIDLLAALGTKKFLYNSMRYFGRPSKKDILNAEYLLHLPPIPSEPKRRPYIPIQDTLETFKKALHNYGIECKIELSNKVISQAMVLNSTKTILIRPDAKFTQKEVNALIEHEIGVHMVTTQNSIHQKLKIFNLGLPINTETQEGMAILSEYLSGNITLERLKKIALRVIVSEMICHGADFIECFHFLIDKQNVPPQDAYIIVTRIFRGGGFTKDFLYLSGFAKILKFWNAGNSLTPLLIGKTSLSFYETVYEMMERKMIAAPKFITKSFEQPQYQLIDPIYEYILSGLK